jgi:hypothetical protein
MAATLTEALVQVRSIIDEPVAQFWSDDELTSWINQGCQEIQREVEWAQAGPVVINTTSGTQDYKAPQDLLRIHRLEFVPNNNTAYTYSLEFRGYNEMDAAWGNLKTLPSAYPAQFTLWNNPNDSAADVGLTILLYPVPSVDGYLNVYYLRTIVPVATGSDYVDVLPGWEDTVYSFAAYRALRKDADPRWNDFKTEFAMQIEQMKTVSRTYTDQPNWFSTGQQNYNPLFLDLD